MKKIIAFTDGACRGNGNAEDGSAVGAWAFYLSFNGYENSKAKATVGRTNNYNEIMAFIQALSAIKPQLRSQYSVEINSDSAYVINCMTNKWYKGWQKNGWVNSKGKPVANRELWETLLSLITEFQSVSYVKVKGHSINQLNNFVDKLCNDAMDEKEQELL